MKAHALINRFNHWHGNEVSVATMKSFHGEIQTYIDSVGHGPGVPELKGILQRITKALKGKPGDGVFERVEITPVEIKKVEVKKVEKPKVKVDGPPAVKKSAPKKPKNKKPIAKKKIVKEPVAKVRVPDNKSLAKVKKSPTEIVKPPQEGTANKKSLSGVDYKYKEIDLGSYKDDFHRMFSDTIVQIHGKPGHGKTTWLLKYAQYRAEQGENVLYVAREEYGRSVFDMKLIEQNIGHANLRFKRELKPEDMKWATVIILDSVSALKLNHEDVEELTIQYPNRNWYVVLQSTKDGDFRGSNEWEHLVDIAGEVSNRKLILRKNRLDQNNAKKYEELKTEDAIAEAKKKKTIREAVKKVEQAEQHYEPQLKVA